MGTVADDGVLSMPQMECFQDNPGELVGLLEGTPPASTLYFDADTTQEHPLVSGCPQLVIPGRCPVFTQLLVIRRPTSAEIRKFRVDGYKLVSIRHTPGRPELTKVCDRIVHAVESRRHIQAGRSSPPVRRRSPQPIAITEAGARVRKPPAHSRAIAAA